MLNIKETFGSFSTDDISKTKDFYGEKLGLKVELDDRMGNLIVYSGDNKTMIYPKENHTPAEFTVLNFTVDDVEKTVDELTRSDITFEQYGGDIKTDEKGISRNEGITVAWFKDPAGNILSIVEDYKI